ncbi:MAG: tRNA 2-thiocytidine biosynthesis protein TtcA [Oscillospiraceae bacterium]|nr:tRNA 2-thiocytidine biosynthesis protein TtcA [Candidatus Ruminococcus equi]
MKEDLSKAQSVRRSISKKFRQSIWAKFIGAIKHYDLIKENDKIAVCISGGKDSMLMAVLFSMLKEHTEIPFEVVYLVMNPGYNEANLQKLKENAELLNIPIEIFESDIFRVVSHQEKSPCYLCARMRRGNLYSKAKSLGCNKIALGHHFSDVIETTVMGMFYSSQLQAMLPKLKSQNFEGMELIRPLYCINEEDIVKWTEYNSLSFLRCACRFTENSEEDELLSKRKETKHLIKELKKTNKNIENSIFSSIHNVCLDTFPSYKSEGEEHSFLDKF